METANDDPDATPVIRVRAAPANVALSAARDHAVTGRVVSVGPTGVDALDPLVTVTRGRTTRFYATCTPERIRALVAAAEDGELSGEDADAVVDHDPEPSVLPTPESGALSVGRRRTLARCGWVAPDDVCAYTRFVADDDPDATLATVRTVGLLGRGRGDVATDEPLADAWETARDADGEAVVVVNANEADRRIGGDRLLLESDPIAVLDAAVAVAGVVGADDVVVYANEVDEPALDRVRQAVAGTEFDPEPQVVGGPDRFVAGEMTMALESMEGNDRLEARLRPPSPTEYGLYGRPTVLHTPRTLAQVREALVRPASFDPDDADPGTRLVTVTGDVDATTTVELPTSTSLAAVREAVTIRGRYKMACVGGQFGGLTRSLDIPASAPAMAAADLGTDGAVELLNDGRCAVATAGTRVRFAGDENCGRCVPCREGSTQLTSLLREVYDGDYRDDGIRELARVMKTTSTCEFGRMAPRPVTTAMDAFETEFLAHAAGRCPAGSCQEGRR